jgi:hypothetical protein
VLPQSNLILTKIQSTVHLLQPHKINTGIHKAAAQAFSTETNFQPGHSATKSFMRLLLIFKISGSLQLDSLDPFGSFVFV